MRLITDFREPYDHWLPSSVTDPREWDRRSEVERDRRQDHQILRDAGFQIPSCGRLDWFSREAAADPSAQVVAYVGPRMHRGEGKLKGHPQDMLLAGVRPDTYCSKWVSSDSDVPIMSTRLLLVGDLRIGYDMIQPDAGEWRSNVGDCYTQQLIGAGEGYFAEFFEDMARIQKMLKAPLVAVDFVPDGRGYWIAVDLATAPGLQGVPGLPGWEGVAGLIATRFDELQHKESKDDR